MSEIERVKLEEVPRRITEIFHFGEILITFCFNYVVADCGRLPTQESRRRCVEVEVNAGFVEKCINVHDKYLVKVVEDKGINYVITELKKLLE